MVFKKGHKQSEETKQKMSLSKLGEKNPNWVGDNIGYDGLHIWIKRHKPKSDVCKNCNQAKPYDLANISQQYKRDINDYKWLCRKCHMEEDGRMKKLNGYQKGRIGWNKGLPKEQQPNYGKTHKLSEESKNKISETRKRLFVEGKLTSWNNGLPREMQPMYGKRFSEESRLKISLALKGHKSWNKGKTGIYSKETIEKMKLGRLKSQQARY